MQRLSICLALKTRDSLDRFSCVFLVCRLVRPIDHESDHCRSLISKPQNRFSLCSFLHVALIVNYIFNFASLHCVISKPKIVFHPFCFFVSRHYICFFVSRHEMKNIRNQRQLKY